MKRAFFLAFSFMVMTSLRASAEEVTNFQQAKSMSAHSRKPILLDFYRDDCNYCAEAAHDAAVNDDIMRAFESVIHYHINVTEEEGSRLGEEYKVGRSFPVFILTDSTGEIINRWSGYAGSGKFLARLGEALSNLTTIDDRETAFKDSPTFREALALAGYFHDAREHLKAISYYRRAGEIIGSGAYDYSFDIFTNTADAIWKDLLPFEDALAAADTVLARGITANVINVARIMIRLARDKGGSGKIGKYIQAGIDATADKPDEKNRQMHETFKIDYILFGKGDTTAAVELKKESLGEGWEDDPDRYFPFAEWCLERKINLREAEMYAVWASEFASPGRFRARVLSTLAQICDAGGKTEKAIRVMEDALKEDPDNDIYLQQWEHYHRKLGH
jgi:thioredoxin-related protein